MAQHEFLPLCDVLFNIISLAAYFCDIVFDVVMGYALFVQGDYIWFIVIIILVIFSSIVEQIISVKWYLQVLKTKSSKEAKEESVDSKSVINYCHSVLVVLLHVTQLGVFWRYFKLFVPVDLRYVKFEVRDLCMLRLVHAFCESMPLLLIQMYLYSENHSETFRDLNIVSMLLSLFNVCWAFASFSKNVRMHNVHRLVLTWLGVIFQFFWRLGTVGARAVSLTCYANLFKYWIFLVIFLHWISMFLWILSPKHVFHGERLPFCRKVMFCTVIAFVYIFCYINLIEVNHRDKMMMFYVVMGLENAMLMFVWIVGVTDNAPWYRLTLPLAVCLMYIAGLGFMWLYYRYFHVRRLKYEAGGRYSNNNVNTPSENNVFVNSAAASSTNAKCDDYTCSEKDIVRRHSFSGDYSNLNDLVAYSRMRNESSMSGEENRGLQKLPANGGTNHVVGIPGVFNCRFSNPYVAAMQKRKRKKPTSFVPPPSIGQTNGGGSSSLNNIVDSLALANEDRSMPRHNNNNHNGYNSVPFWCRPLPCQYSQQVCCSENDCSSVGSRPDIHRKLQEKKRKQLAELKKIEEEIKLGKLHRRPANSPMAEPSAPPPQDKQSPHYESPEILLAPRFLNGVNGDENQYYDWAGGYEDGNIYRYPMAANFAPGKRIPSALPTVRLLDEESLELYKTYRVPSDLDSQLSLPRSYTLPREFKYYRRTRTRKPIRPEHFVPSTNSSDGDVDSGDESDSASSHATSQPQPLKLLPNTILRVRHETKL